MWNVQLKKKKMGVYQFIGLLLMNKEKFTHFSITIFENIIVFFW